MILLKYYVKSIVAYTFWSNIHYILHTQNI